MMELNKLKIKLQYADDRAEKDAGNLREKQGQVEGLIKDYEEQVSGLEQAISVLRVSEKEWVEKVQKMEMESIRAEERNEKVRKELRVLEERCGNQENSLKGKLGEVQALQSDKEGLERRNGELESELNGLKNEHLTVSNERNKVAKISEILQEDLIKAKAENTNLKATVGAREREGEELRVQVSSAQDENTKLDLKYSNFKKEIDRNKDTLFDLIQKYLFTLPLTPNEDSRANVDLLLLTKRPV